MWSSYQEMYLNTKNEKLIIDKRLEMVRFANENGIKKNIGYKPSVKTLKSTSFHIFLSVFSFTTEENQIARLQVAEVGCYLQAFAFACLLRGIAGDNDVVHQQHGTHKSTTIHPFGSGACP